MALHRLYVVFFNLISENYLLDDDDDVFDNFNDDESMMVHGVDEGWCVLWMILVLAADCVTTR